jgi:hypothetical protein
LDELPGARSPPAPLPRPLARLVTALVAERGVCPASHAGLLELFPERGALTAAAQRILDRLITSFRSLCCRARFPGRTLKFESHGFVTE